MKLSIVTINYNDAVGLKKTLESVAMQKPCDCEVEHIVVDGGSTDESVDVIKQYPHVARWVSEKDYGIYNAMNKGIKMATGDYCQFLNAGDMLAGPDVISQMCSSLVAKQFPDILYGQMRKVFADGSITHDISGGGREYTLMLAYHGCLNHSPAYIRRSLFDKFGLYDETLKICSDWKWYLQTIVLGGTQAVYTPVLVTIFDMGGVSETRKDILEEERTRLLKELVPLGILHDYDRYYFPMEQYDRLKRHHLWSVVYFVERVLFKLEKWHILR